MLPGFRFLFAAMVLSISILVFGLGAAALLRAAHEEVASTPSWRPAPETIFAQQPDAPTPALAMLRAEPAAAEPKPPDDIPAMAAAAEAAATVAPAEPGERIAALKPSSPAEATKPENPVAESPPQSELQPVAADAPAAAAATSSAALQGVASSANQIAPVGSEPIAAPAAPDQASPQASPDLDIATTKIATLGGPPVTIEMQRQAKATSTKPDSSAIKKRAQAQRTVQRRKLALRARAARQAPQRPANPFGQPAVTVRNR